MASKRSLLLATALACLAAGAAAAQTDAPPPPDPVDAPDMPTLVDDREVPRPPDDALPEKVLEPPSTEAAPAVSIRTDGSGDVVEEYRQNGQIYMVKVRPKIGPAYSLIDSNGDGKLDAQDGDGPVRPVYWTLYEWN
jgi:hypothetical protein